MKASGGRRTVWALLCEAEGLEAGCVHCPQRPGASTPATAFWLQLTPLSVTDELQVQGGRPSPSQSKLAGAPPCSSTRAAGSAHIAPCWAQRVPASLGGGLATLPPRVLLVCKALQQRQSLLLTSDVFNWGEQYPSG